MLYNNNGVSKVSKSFQCFTKLTFQLVDQSVVYDPQKPDKAPIGSEVLPSDDDPNYKYIVKKRVMVGGENLVDAQPGFDPQTNEPIVTFRFDGIGAKKFGRVTQQNVGGVCIK